MSRSVALALVGLSTILLAGCRDRYKDVADQQIANWKEVASILRDVKDQQSMNDAEDKLLAGASRFQEVSRQAKALPPPDEEASKRLQPEAVAMQSALRDMLKEMTRVKKLPGGPEFFERVKESLPSVSEGSIR
jgi:hypothetical protein